MFLGYIGIILIFFLLGSMLALEGFYLMGSLLLLVCLLMTLFLFNRSRHRPRHRRSRNKKKKKDDDDSFVGEVAEEGVNECCDFDCDFFNCICD